MFLSSQGVDPKSVTSGGEATTYSSGVERLLALFEKFEASRTDYDLFKWVEREVYEIVLMWCQVLDGTNVLDQEYKLGTLPSETSISVKYEKPEAVVSETEKLEAIERKLDLGLISQEMAIAEYHEVSDEKALELMEKINAETTPRIENNEEGSLSEV